MKIRILSLCIFSVIIFCIFHNWFFLHDITGGDWPFFFPQRLYQTAFIPPAWNSVLNNGLGGISPLYSLQVFHQFTISISNIFHIPWIIIYKIFWFGMFLFFSIFSSIFFLKSIFPKSSVVLQLVCALIFTTNTYILMIVGGGQMGVALAYALTPLVVGLYIQLVLKVVSKEKQRILLRQSLIFGTIFSLQIIFDPRIGYLSIVVMAVFVCFFIKNILPDFLKASLYLFLLPMCLTILLNIFWILPTVVFHSNPTISLGSIYTGVGAFNFFSFADFSHSFSLLHPNWPENIFGKIYFLRPEFLLVPFIAFSSLLFVKKEKNKKLMFFFILLGLLGCFLAKGASDPFGNINSWMFVHIPGFVLFRDPTKFYLLIILSYGILIPFSLQKAAEFFSQKHAQQIIVSLFVIMWIFLIKDALIGRLDGTFAYHNIPSEYRQLSNFIGDQHPFFRTLWVPRQQRFSFVSDNHPAVEAQPLFHATNSAEVISFMQQPDTENYVKKLDIAYVMVPVDSLGEFFVKNGKYDNQQYVDTLQALRQLSWLHEIQGFGKIGVFAVDGYNNHFWSKNGEIIKNTMISPDSYVVEIPTRKSIEIVFVENYSPYWVAKVGNTEIQSKKTKDEFNSFMIQATAQQSVTVYFKEKVTYRIGLLVSFISILTILGVLLYLQFIRIHYNRSVS